MPISYRGGGLFHKRTWRYNRLINCWIEIDEGGFNLISFSVGPESLKTLCSRQYLHYKVIFLLDLKQHVTLYEQLLNLWPIKIVNEIRKTLAGFFANVRLIFYAMRINQFWYIYCWLAAGSCRKQRLGNIMILDECSVPSKDDEKQWCWFARKKGKKENKETLECFKMVLNPNLPSPR